MSDTLRDQIQAALGAAYTLEQELGGGGMSRVFVATDSALGRRVVVKVLPPDTAGSISMERFKREIGIAARLQHAHIVPVLAAGEAAGLPYYTMPFVEGESLRARVNRGGELPLGEAVRVLREVASALAFAHDHGIVHRDIKPDNVLIAGDSAMVTDFGVAKAVSASTTDASSGITSIGVALGTPAYMAPEQATADPLVDHRADIYAFGCLAYELLTGQSPFAGRPTAAMLAAHVRDAPEPLERRRPSVSPALAALIMRCLEKRPADRPQHATEIVRALDQITTPSGGSAPTSLRMTAATAEPAAPSSSRRTIAIAGVGVIALAVVFLGARGLFDRADSQPSPGTASLAVLPLSTEGDTASAFFADGMTEELTSALTKVQGLGVVSQTLSAATVRRNPQADVRAVGRMLSVGAVLEGSVRRSGGRLRVTAQLTNVADGRLLWSESYQGNSDDVFQVQDSIARSIVSALQGTLGTGQTPVIAVAGTRDPRAHELTLRARYYFTQRIRLDTAIVMAREAIDRDSTYAEAWSLLASIYAVLDLWTDAKTDSSVIRAQEYARKALSIDSTLTDARAALGNALVDAGQYAEAMRVYDRGIALNPSHAQIYHWRGILHAAQGRMEEALRDFRMSHTLDPLAPNPHLWFSMTLSGSGRLDEAVREAGAMQETSPAFSIASMFTLAATYASMNQPALAATYADSVNEAIRQRLSTPNIHMVRGIIGSVYARTGRAADAREQLAALRAVPPTARAAHYGMGLAGVYLGLGFPDSALTALEDNFDMLTATQFAIMSMSVIWRSDQFLNHPRYQQLLRRAGLRD